MVLWGLDIISSLAQHVINRSAGLIYCSCETCSITRVLLDESCQNVQLTVEILGNTVPARSLCQRDVPSLFVIVLKLTQKTPTYKFIPVVNFVSFPFLLKFHFLLWKPPPPSPIQCVAKLHSNSEKSCYVVGVFLKTDFLLHQKKISFTRLHQAADDVKTHSTETSVSRRQMNRSCLRLPANSCKQRRPTWRDWTCWTRCGTLLLFYAHTGKGSTAQ